MTPSTTVECTYCGRSFATEELLALHNGHQHEDRLDTDERVEYMAAYEAETEALRLYRLKAVTGIVILYFSFLFAYAIFG